MLQGEILSPSGIGDPNNQAIIPGQDSMLAQADLSIADLTNPQKAAIILVSMDPGYAAPIVEKLTDVHMQRFVKALEELREVPRPKMLAVIAAFVVELNTRQNLFRAGPNKAMDIAGPSLINAPQNPFATSLPNRKRKLRPLYSLNSQMRW